MLTLRMVLPLPPLPKAAAEKRPGTKSLQETQIADAMALRQSMIETIQGVPGVENVAETSKLPLNRSATLWAIH